MTAAWLLVETWYTFKASKIITEVHHHIWAHNSTRLARGIILLALLTSLIKLKYHSVMFQSLDSSHKVNLNEQHSHHPRTIIVKIF